MDVRGSQWKLPLMAKMVLTGISVKLHFLGKSEVLLSRDGTKYPKAETQW
jgi:hypothetical protein